MTLAESRERGLNQPTIAFWDQDYTTDYSVVNVSDDKLNIRSVDSADDSLVDDVTLVRSGATAKPSDEKPNVPAEESSSQAVIGVGVAAVLTGIIGAIVANFPQIRSAVEQFAAQFGIQI